MKPWAARCNYDTDTSLLATADTVGDAAFILLPFKVIIQSCIEFGFPWLCRSPPEQLQEVTRKGSSSGATSRTLPTQQGFAYDAALDQIVPTAVPTIISAAQGDALQARLGCQLVWSRLRRLNGNELCEVTHSMVTSYSMTVAKRQLSSLRLRVV